VSKGKNTAITAAVITATGGIVAAIIAASGSTGTTSSSAPTYASGTIQVSAGYAYAYVYSIPTGNLNVDQEGELSVGTNVQIICTEQGPAVNGDTLWDEIVYNAGSAYISDFFVLTGTNQATMPACS
jgi:hypothetical protein